MAESYNRVISALGLNECREDLLFGTVEQELPGLDALQGQQEFRVSLNRLPDGGRLLMFQFGPQNEGALWPMPCSLANAEAVGEFLRRAEAYLPPADAPPDVAEGALDRLRQWFTPGRAVEVMAPLTHRHFEGRIELRLLANQRGRYSLLLTARGPRCRFDRSWQWSPTVAAEWQRILATLHDGLTDWPDKTEGVRAG